MLTNVVAPDKLGGLERYVRELSAALCSSGVDVTVVAKAVGSAAPRVEQSDDGVKIIRYDPPRKSDPLFALKYPAAISRGVRLAMADLGGGSGETVLVHGHFAVPMIPILVRRAPFVYTFHAPVHKELLAERQDSYRLPKAVQGAAVAGLRRLEAKVVGRAQRVVVLSDFMRREVAALDHRAAGRVVAIPGGIDERKFFLGTPPTSAPRPLSGSGPVLFAARRLVSRTGVEQLIAAYGLIAGRYPQSSLVVAGSGSRASNVAALVDSLGLKRQVHLVGYVSEQELVDWYRFADIAITPTQELEGFGLSTAEAMACGAIPLVTPVGANPELVSGLPPELVSLSASVEDIAASLERLILNDALRASLRGAPVAARAERYGWENVASKHLEIYSQLSAAGWPSS